MSMAPTVFYMPGHSIYTEADTWGELKIAVQGAVACHFDDERRPSMVRLHVVRDEIFSVW